MRKRALKKSAKRVFYRFKFCGACKPFCAAIFPKWIGFQESAESEKKNAGC